MSAVVHPGVAADHSEPSVAAPDRPSRALLSFLVFEMACQIGLLFPELGGFRTALRIAAFAGSLVLFVVLPGQGIKHPAAGSAFVVLAIITLSFLHPNTHVTLAPIAHAAMYAAIIAPIYWVPRLALGRATLHRALLLLWCFHTASAVLGVMQVYFPGIFQPNISPMLEKVGPGYVDSLQITLASGEKVFRPMGLTDIPGGAGTGGFYAVVFGIGIYMTTRRFLLKLAAVGSMLAGVMVVYFCQIRATLVMLAVCVFVIAALLARHGKIRRFASFAAVLVAVTTIGFSLSSSKGGEAMQRRISTLVSDDPRNVYNQNRGKFLEHTIEDLVPEYPLGAGLARWGMMRGYFGDDGDPASAPLWVEIQWTGWVLDGGLPLVFAYSAALAAALVMALKVALRRSGDGHEDIHVWGIIFFAYGIGALALTFSYSLFMGQPGLEFWVLNSMLLTVGRTVQQQARST